MELKIVLFSVQLPQLPSNNKAGKMHVLPSVAFKQTDMRLPLLDFNARPVDYKPELHRGDILLYAEI